MWKVDGCGSISSIYSEAMKVAGETWQRRGWTSPAAGSYIQPWRWQDIFYTVLFLFSLQILFLVSISVSWITSQSGQQFYLSLKVCKNLLALHNVNIRRNYVMMIAWQLAKEQLKRLITPFFSWVYSLWLHHLSIYQEKLLFMRYLARWYCAWNNSRSPDIVRPNFENVQPISHYSQTRWPNISPAQLELSSSGCCQSINYVWFNLSNVWPKGRFERPYGLWIMKNHFQHCW